jgi:adenylate kinase family enzyme
MLINPPSQQVLAGNSTFKEVPVQQSSLKKESLLLQNPGKALKNLKALRSGLARYRQLPKDTTGHFSEKEKLFLIRLLRRRIIKTEVKDLLLLLDSYEK